MMQKARQVEISRHCGWMIELKTYRIIRQHMIVFLTEINRLV
jgi:hypothetical protein